MGKSLHDQVKELESQLGSNLTEGDEENGNEGRSGRDESIETEGAERSSPDTDLDEAEDVGSRRTRDRGRHGRRTGGDSRSSGKASQGSGEDAPEDGDAPRETSGRASRDGGSSRGNASDGDEVLDKEDSDSPAAMARLRRENRELKAKLLREEEERAQTSRVAEQKPAAETKTEDPDPEPNKAENPEGWKDWKIRQLDRVVSEIKGETQQSKEQQIVNERIKGAIDEFRDVRDKYIQKNPDFTPAFTHAYNKYAEAIKLTNPSWDNQRIIKEIDWQLLLFAGDVAKKGGNPAEALYDLAIERFGYIPGKEGKADVSETSNRPDGVRGPNLRTVDNNRRRSASGLGTSGQGNSARITKESIANMTNGELMNLSPEDWAELERLG